MDYNYPALFTVVGLVAVLAIALFMILRGVVLWYYKIDTMVQNQKKQIDLLTELLSITKKVNQYPE